MKGNIIMKFIEHCYNPENGHTTVIMQHLGVKFVGEAQLNPEGDDPGNKIAGGKIAEARAMIKALKYERKIAKAKADEAIDFVKAIECYAKFNKEDESAKTVYRQLNQRIKKVNDLADKINEQYENIDNWISNRAIFLKRLEKLKEEKTEKVN